MKMSETGHGVSEQALWDNNFNLIRLFAASQVMLGHAVAHLKLPIWEPAEYLLNAFPGVPIFFVVSGFVIAGSYARSDELKKFISSRCLRIYPALWVNLLGITILLALFGSLAIAPTTLRFWLWHASAFALGSDYLANNLFANIFSGEGAFSFYPSGVLWTLPVELSFYLLVPIIFAKSLANRGLVGASIIFWVCISALCFFLIERSGDWLLFVGLYLWIFLLGAAAQTYWDRIKWVFFGRASVWIIGHLIFTGIIIFYTDALPVYATPNWLNIFHTLTLSGATLSSAFTFPHLAKRILRDRDMSYGLYLWHMPVICIFMVYGLTESWPHFCVAAALSIVIAGFSMQFIEKPALRLKKMK